jgi:hypothetical protein|uniref:Minor capsid protein P8 central region domain-containing protein n=1 Tax=viral metagenome TaxID=1070528 RepID=A0A6C0ILK3_9ZZZZ
MNSLNNGRVNLNAPNTSKLFEMYDKIPSKEHVSFRNPTTGIWENSPLSGAFFSKENMKILQNGIRAGVYQKSGETQIIGEQDYDTLKIIMRSIFLENAKNAPNNIKGQIQELNQIVMNYCIDQIMIELKGYMIYLKDITTMHVPIDLPKMSNVKHKDLQMKNWF